MICEYFSPPTKTIQLKPIGLQNYKILIYSFGILIFQTILIPICKFFLDL